MITDLNAAHILDPLNKDQNKLYELFEKIYAGNTILFLGAGASITDKKYLSNQIIEYYNNKLGISSNINDIVKFVDMLTSNPVFNRKDFDNFVKDLLQKLHYNEVHKTILSINWRIIITTNYDLLLEQAYEEIKNSSEKAFELYVVRNLKEYEGYVSRDTVKYVKLNGCMSDMGKYKFVFSSNDFDRANKYYKKVLNEMKNLSPDINFLSVGYSYGDPLAQLLLEKFDSYNYRSRKTMYSIDPSVDENDYRLGFFNNNKMCVIKMTGLEFFNEYKKWEENKYRNKSQTKILKINGVRKEPISIGYKLAYNLKLCLNQIGQNYEGENINEKDFYLGQEPNFNNIRKGHDVIRKAKVGETIKFVWNEMKSGSIMIPFIYLTGSFGTGKTTFVYRILNSIINDIDKEALAFEITDIENFRKELALDFINSLPVRNIIFYCNDLEVDSYYKTSLRLRNDLSFEQISGKNICFISSIRENILTKHRQSNNGTNMHEFNIDSPLNSEEIDDLLTRLNDNTLISYRDNDEKSAIRERIISDLDSDTFVSLLDILTEGKHILDLMNAYSQLSHKMKEAFIYTALLHRCGLSMPGSLLKNIISVDWDDFTKKVLKAEGKGILLHDKVNSSGLDPDIYFKTKHRIVADKLVNYILKDGSKRFDYYVNIVRHLNTGFRSGRLLINLIKFLKESTEVNEFQINHLYDTAYSILQDDAHFLLSYSTNLQYRNSIDSIEKGIELIQYAESILPERKNRDSRFIHRRGVLNFALAKLYHEQYDLDQTLHFLYESEDLLSLKLQLDPTSSYSYTDYIQLLMWKLDKLKLSDVENIRIKVKIEDLLSTALNTISDNQNRIIELQLFYVRSQQFDGNEENYLKDLEELYYNKVELRPYVCILLYNYYKDRNKEEEASRYLSEIEHYKEEEDIAAFLFKVYGRLLHNATIRNLFHKISRRLSSSKKINGIRYNYFNYVAYFYDGYMQDAGDFLQNIKNNFPSSNPEFNLKWLDSDGSVKVFDGFLKKDRSYFYFKVRGQAGKFRITKSTYSEDFKEGDKCKAELYFYLSGVFASIIKQ